MAIPPRCARSRPRSALGSYIMVAMSCPSWPRWRCHGCCLPRSCAGSIGYGRAHHRCRHEHRGERPLTTQQRGTSMLDRDRLLAVAKRGANLITRLGAVSSAGWCPTKVCPDKPEHALIGPWKPVVWKIPAHVRIPPKGGPGGHAERGLVARAGTSCRATPVPPCAGDPLPAVPSPDAAPTLALWHAADLPQGWAPAACSGLGALTGGVVVALSGSFHHAGEMSDLLARLGAISTHTGILYWNVADAAWRPVLADATALASADPEARRPDFAPANAAGRAAAPAL